MSIGISIQFTGYYGCYLLLRIVTDLLVIAVVVLYLKGRHDRSILQSNRFNESRNYFAGPIFAVKSRSCFDRETPSVGRDWSRVMIRPQWDKGC